ncbi:MAG: Eco57I restriction-modification methylase domain-containing protein [Ferruginibacter sp.]
MTITEIKYILESPYDRKIWKNFLKTQFTNNKLNAEDRLIKLADNMLSKECLSLGNYEINEYTKIGIFEVRLEKNVKLSRNRVGLRNLTKSITAQVAGAMVVFVQGDKWRFSYISKRKVKNKDTNLIEDKETAPKRYTYLFGKGEKALTAAQRFDKLIKKQKANLYEYLSLDDFEDAFSVEKLSKEFFDKYKEIYEDFVEFVTGKRFVKKGSKWIELKTHEAQFQLRNYFDNNEKAARDFFKRMLGRIVFLYFIQKKGWLAVKKGKEWGEGDPDYLYQLFHKAKYKDSFYSDYLVPLFFDTLNNIKSQDESNEFRFPYLNGGLFDKTQDFKYDKIALPAEIFEKLFDTFSNYNFTIYEDGPDEQTVAVDPEMLGHIFENLLEDNKDKGAFYTPKDIVHYMCRESLHNYIYTYTGNEHDEDFKQRLLQYNDTYDINVLSKEELKQVDRALEDVRICDPAIGSGAFPMGLLHEIYHLKIPIEDAKGFRAKSPADLKKHIIEESIYGIDIDSGAVDIARLRFWLSLVVDETEPQPLPNLAFKIVCANTLIPLGMDNTIQIAGATDIIKEIEKVRHDYFDASKEEKKDLERRFKNLQNKLWTTAKDWVTSKDAILYQKLLEFNPFEDNSCGWFDAWWMFGVKDGFDIVIGNPPYVQLQKDGGKLAKLYLPYNYETFERTGDLYSLFYERGTELLNDKGMLCFITSNKWMRANYGASTRRFFSEKTYPLLLIDFGNVQIFDTATVDTNILLLQNKPKARIHEVKETYAVRINNDFDIKAESLQEYVLQNGYTLSSLNQNAWVVGERDVFDIKSFVEQQGITITNWDVVINYGLKTGFNDAFIIKKEIKDKLVSEDRKSAEVIKPMLRGKDISAWYPEFEELYLIVSHNGIKEKSIPRINIEENYPAIYRWLKGFQGQLMNRLDKGDHWTNLRNCAYILDFETPKIIYPEITKYIPFVYDENDFFYTNNKNFILTGERLKYLTCFFNSKLFKYCFSDNFPELQGGSRELRKIFFEKIPVKRVSDKQEIPFAKMVDYLVALKKEASRDLNDQLMLTYFEQLSNALVFELYFKEAFEDRKLQVAAHVSELPDLHQEEKPLHQLRKIYVSINQDRHPLKQATFSMLAIPQIELILNSVEI